MTLGELVFPISYTDAKGMCLVFSIDLASRLAELHALHGSANCVPAPRTMTDGRLMLPATVLTEIAPGGLLHAMWEAADKDVLAQAVQVMSREDAVALLPPDPPAGQWP